jgi:hypothetical protein
MTQLTKPCLECTVTNDADAASCVACGGGSFPDTVAAMHEHDVEQTRARRREEGEAQDREYRAWADATDDQREAWWAVGKCPPGMCRSCPALMMPCQACFVRAGYDGELYEAFTKTRELPIRTIVGIDPASEGPESTVTVVVKDNAVQTIVVVDAPDAAATDAFVAAFTSKASGTLQHPEHEESPETIQASPPPPPTPENVQKDIEQAVDQALAKAEDSDGAERAVIHGTAEAPAVGPTPSTLPKPIATPKAASRKATR